MNKIYLDIDYREKAIIKLLNNKEIDANYTKNICNLYIGDFIIKKEDDTVGDAQKEQIIKSNLYYIIERKSVFDLAASIIDGRFREQKKD